MDNRNDRAIAPNRQPPRWRRDAGGSAELRPVAAAGRSADPAWPEHPGSFAWLRSARVGRSETSAASSTPAGCAPDRSTRSAPPGRRQSSCAAAPSASRLYRPGSLFHTHRDRHNSR